MNILDAGSVRLVEYWGSDEAIIRSARMSTNKGFNGWDKDAGLLRYLYTHQHMTPFEMAGAIFEVKAPIFVFREWHRHRTQSYNEMSARYIPLPDENYIPTKDRLYANQGTTNKQAQGAKQLDTIDALRWLAELERFYEGSQYLYQRGLAIGVPKELARLCVHVARYSKMRASANLRNWLGFLTLRQAEDAQWDIRQYADAVGAEIAQLFPRTWELFKGE